MSETQEDSRYEDLDPNPEQQELIDGTEGIYKVDAGPGTGKTFVITRRYASIIEQPGVDPEDALLVTFTNSAATEMKERIVTHSDYGMRELADAPIQTFHSRCYDILSEFGYAAPAHLGISDRITGSTRIIDDELVEQELFDEFFSQFRDRHSEYVDFFRALSSPTELLDLITELASKGIFPTAEGWYRDGEEDLDGDYDTFKERFDELNQPRNGGSKQSKLRSKLSRFGGNKTYVPDAPSKTELRGSRGTKQLDDAVARRVFEEDRSDLKAFVHDIYYEYLEFALSRNYLTFSFLQLFAFVLLCEDDEVREAAAADYVMVDEFQDSSEIQFKLALLLAGTDNFCVVGDWKQSIYSFQYAAVENITEFETRLQQFIADLNDDRDRVGFDDDEINRIDLQENYRSTETILDFAREALVTPATSSDDVSDDSLDDYTDLYSNAAFDNTQLENIGHEDECEAVLTKVQEIVDNDTYAIEGENGEPRPPEYSDIAVLTRTRDYGRELLQVASDHELPVAYDGGVELFRTDQAKLLLAWLRILEDDIDRGWAVVLEKAGYTLDEIDAMLQDEQYPESMVEFRQTVASMDSVGAVARRVFDRYGFAGEYADVLLHTIQSLHESSTLTRGDLIRLIERGIETGTTQDIHTSAGADSVTVQTIHAAKGLEYPIVVLANMNDGKFPPSGGGNPIISYNETVGLRQRKRYAEYGEFPHVYHNWRHDIIRHCLSQDYDEERRLLYVALTRAESHIVLVSGDEPNTFSEELPIDQVEYEPDIDEATEVSHEQAQLPFIVATPDGPTGYSPHSLMDDEVFDDVPKDFDGIEGRGMEFGTQVHEFAEAYALGEDVTPSNTDERRIKSFLDDCTGELIPEEHAHLPLTVDSDQVMVAGVIDLLEIQATTARIVDYKTDQSRHAEPEYRKQLSVYYHVVSECYPDRDVTTSIYYTTDDELVEIEPLSLDIIRDLVRQNCSKRTNS